MFFGGFLVLLFKGFFICDVFVCWCYFSVGLEGF